LKKGRSPQGWAGVCLWFGGFAVFGPVLGEFVALDALFCEVAGLAVLFGFVCTLWGFCITRDIQIFVTVGGGLSRRERVR